MSDLWDMTAAAVSFVFGLGVIAGVVITVSGWGIYGTLFDSAAEVDSASTDCACTTLSGATVPARRNETADLRLAPRDEHGVPTR